MSKLTTPQALATRFDEAVRAQRAGHRKQAEAAYRSILAVVPQHLDTAHNLAVLLSDEQRHTEALALWQSVLAAQPDSIDAHIEAAFTRIRMGDAGGAKADLLKAAGLASRNDKIWRRIASGLVLLGQYSDAVDAYTIALDCNPQEPQNYTAFASLCSHLGEYGTARELALAATQLAPGLLWAWIELGRAQLKEGNATDASASFRQAIQIAPDDPVGYCNLAITQMESMQLDAALASLNRALTHDPTHPLAHWNRALVLLIQGHLQEAWSDYEYRRQANIQGIVYRPETPQWRGEPIQGRRILLLCEQGLGDSLQFIRYAKLLKAKGAWIAARIQKPLVRLFRELTEIDLLLDEGDPVPGTDFHCHLLSLPLAFGTGLADIPASIPYLSAPQEASRRWQVRLCELPQPRIGLVWAGGKRQHMADAVLLDNRRSLHLRQLLPLAAIAGVHYFSLQKDQAASQVAELAGQWPIEDFSAELVDFAETAALVEQLDLVISVDTAVAHLAGALGKPVWLLNRWDTDWRWLLGRDDSPWYPTLRQFRQPQAGDWESAIAELACALSRWAEEWKSAALPAKTAGAAIIGSGDRDIRRS